MKKIFIFLFILFSTKSTQAQHFYFGVQGGLMFNQSNIESTSNNSFFDPSYSLEARSLMYNQAFNKALFLGLQFSNHWAVESQLQLSKEGFEEKDYRYFCIVDDNTGIASYAASEMKINHDYEYLRLPLLMRYYIFPNKNRFNISASAGLSFGFLLHQKNTAVYTDLYGQEIMTYSKDESAKNKELGYQLGLKTEYYLTKNLQIAMEANWFHIDNLNKSEVGDNYNPSTLINTHTIFNLGIGYRF